MSILTEADALINGEKAEAYGDPKENLQNIAFQWAAYISQASGKPVMLNAEDVCWMMTLLKMCRQMHKNGRDNLVDAAGYIGLIEKVGGAGE